MCSGLTLGRLLRGRGRRSCFESEDLFGMNWAILN